MTSRSLLLALAISVLLFCPNGVSSSQEEPAESIVLQGGGRGDVTFPHGRHQEVDVDCRPCHEMFAKEALVIDKMKAEGNLKKKEVMNMCKGCHKDMAAEGKKAGPVGCGDCHKK